MAKRKPAKATKISKKRHSVQASVYAAKDLGLDKRMLPHSIIEVVATLKRSGFYAYIVGGGVRDGLLGLAPKDFDAVTDARPHEIKAIFGGRCRIIGRRFQLAHVYSGKDMIEVATFRAPPKDDTFTTDDGMITRDNVWGTIEEDFARRDFSINALYYDPIDDVVLDFCGAIDDIPQKKLTLLGDAKVRIEEDPVRLLRALRFKAKLGFDFHKSLAVQFNQANWNLLEQVSTHRLYDETQKMFGGGYLTTLLPLLFKYGAIHHIMAAPPSAPTALMGAAANNTDKRVASNLGANPAFFYAVLLWENYLTALAGFKKKGLPFYDAQSKAISKIMTAQRQKTAIPKFAEEFIAGIWLLQPKLTNPRQKDIHNLVNHNKFRAAFDFLLMRESYDDCVLSEPTNGMGVWWQTYQETDGKNPQKSLPVAQKTENSKKQITVSTKQEEVLLPQFAKITYTEADFLRLLNLSEEPFIPSQRYRRRTPSSEQSVLEQQELAKEKMDKNHPKKEKSAKKKRKKSAVKNEIANKDFNKSKKSKSKKGRKKSNAKPKAKE